MKIFWQLTSELQKHPERLCFLSPIRRSEIWENMKVAGRFAQSEDTSEAQFTELRLYLGLQCAALVN